MPTFAQLGLLDALIKALPDTFPGPTPLQCLAIPTLLQGRDLIALAPDGAGKTVAWSLALLHKMARPPVSAEPNTPRSLVVVHSPQRAESVAVDFSRLGTYVPVRHAAAEDGSSWNRTVSALKAGVETLVGTPRQILDLFKQRELKLHGIELVVIDDAEQLLDGEHQEPIDQLLPELPIGRQTAMFTASRVPELRALAVLWLTNPVAIKPPPVETKMHGLEGPIHLPSWLDEVPEVVLPDWLSDPDGTGGEAKPRKVAKSAGGKPVSKGVAGKAPAKNAPAGKPTTKAPVSKQPAKVPAGKTPTNAPAGKSPATAPGSKPPAAGPSTQRPPTNKSPTPKPASGPSPKPTPKPQLPPRPPAPPSSQKGPPPKPPAPAKRPAAGPPPSAPKKPPRPGPGKRG